MVWYVPPLCPILQRVTSDVYLPDAHEMRVPVQYLANLFTAGNTEILARTLQRVLDMREYMRRRETGDGPIDHKVDLTEDQMYGMYKLLALSKYNDRFVIPSDVTRCKIGLSGGTYQTIGNVRYSGCNGKATPHSFTSLYTGDF